METIRIIVCCLFMIGLMILSNNMNRINNFINKKRKKRNLKNEK